MTFRYALYISVLVAAFTLASGAARAGIADLDKEHACHSLVPAVAGGPQPTGNNVMVLRWLGWSTYEVAYHGKVVLLDAFIDPLPSRGINIPLETIRRADAILIGHAHFDHVLHAAQISKQTGAPIFVAPAGQYMVTDAPANKVRYVRGGETIKMPGFTIRTALAMHSQFLPADVYQKYAAAVKAASPLSEEERPIFDKWMGTLKPADPKDPDSDIMTRGTIAYVVTFDDGARVSYRDSPGVPTDAERALVKSISDQGKTIDVGIVGYNGAGPPFVIEKVGLPLARTYHPAVLLPAHHDRGGEQLFAIATEPYFERLRTELPETKTASPLTRAPVCVDTRTHDLFVNNNAR